MFISGEGGDDTRCARSDEKTAYGEEAIDSNVTEVSVTDSTGTKSSELKRMINDDHSGEQQAEQVECVSFGAEVAP